MVVGEGRLCAFVAANLFARHEPGKYRDMRLLSPKIWIGSLLCVLLLSWTAGGMAGPTKHRRKSKKPAKPVVSAQEARVASVRKAQLRQKQHALRSHIHRVKAKI